MRQRADMIGRWEPSSLQGRSVVVIDDGIATGLTMKAALGAVREAAPEEIVVAAPVADPAAVDELAFLADGVVTLVQPDRFGSLLDWYEDGTVVTDGDVASLVG